MSFEYTIDIQLTELGFPDILETSETPVRETPCLLASQYVSLSGSDPQNQIPTKPSIRQQLEHEVSVTSDSCTSQQTTNMSRSSPSHDTVDTCTNSALPSPVAGGADDGRIVISKGRRTKRLASREQANDKSHEDANDDQVAKESTQDVEVELETTDDSEVSENDEEESNEDQDGVDDESEDTGDYCCSVCGLHLTSNMKLQDHMNLHTGQRPHCCAECGKRFCQLKNYRAHLRTHAKAKAETARCRICRKDFRSKDHLKLHLTTTHFENEFYECDLCKHLFTDRKECELHIELHNGTLEEFACDRCGRQFPDQRSLKRHRFKKCLHSFRCTDCGQTFSRKNALLKHSFSHVGLLPYTCIRCSCHFRLARLYRSHKCQPQRVHCVACLREFLSQEDFQKHKKDTGCWGHQEPKGDEIFCPECGESFSTKEELKKHGSAHQRILTCDECGKGFRSALLLMSHMGGHAAQTPCLCQSCGRGFLHQHDYDRHLERCGLAPLPPTVPKKPAKLRPVPKTKARPVPKPAPPRATATEPPSVTTLPVSTDRASTSGSKPDLRVVNVCFAPTQSPENVAEGPWRLTLDKQPPAGVKLVLFVPLNSPLAHGLGHAVQHPPLAILDAGMGPAVQQPPPPAPAILDTGLGPAVQRSPLAVLGPAVQQPLPAILDAGQGPAVLQPPLATPAILDTAVQLHKSTACLKKSPVVSPPEDTAPLDLVTDQMCTGGCLAPLDLSNKSILLVPPVGIKMEALATAASITAPVLGIKSEAVAPAASVKVPTVGIKEPNVSIKTVPRECRVVLRRLSDEVHGVMGDAFVKLKTEMRDNVGHPAHNSLATVKSKPARVSLLPMDIQKEPKSP